MGFLKAQELDVQGNGNITLSNSFNTDELDKENYEVRKGETRDDLKKGMHLVCRIPAFEFGIDPMLKKYQMLCEMHDAEGARKVLKQFLALNPQYVATSMNF